MSKYRIHYFYAATGEYSNHDIAIVNAESKDEAFDKWVNQYKDRPEIYKWYTAIARDIINVRLDGDSLPNGMTEKSYAFDDHELQIIE